MGMKLYFNNQNDKSWGMDVAEIIKRKIHFEGHFDRPVIEDLWFKSYVSIWDTV